MHEESAVGEGRAFDGDARLDGLDAHGAAGVGQGHEPDERAVDEEAGLRAGVGIARRRWRAGKTNSAVSGRSTGARRVSPRVAELHVARGEFVGIRNYISIV